MEAKEKINQIIKPEVTEPMKNILTAEKLELITTGEVEPPAILQDYIDSCIEYDICDYFHYNNLLILDSDIKIFLTSNYRQENWTDNLKVECIPEYNPLLERMALDPEDYFHTEKYYRPTPESEAIDFLTYYIIEEYLEQQDYIKLEISTLDIIRVLRTLDTDQQTLLRQINYTELFKDIQEAYNQVIQDYILDIEDDLQEAYLNKLYYPAEDAIYQELYNQLQQQDCLDIREL